MKTGYSFPQVKRVGNLTIRYMSNSGKAGMTDRVTLCSVN